ncbi:MAG: hypothetical protein IK016_03465 [Lachnospiraceae bacterium]|nr:hypothetical protein [Lachnospiraceae bacterium]
MKQKKESILRHLRKHTTKITASLCLVTLLCISLMGCGGGGSSKQESSALPAATKSPAPAVTVPSSPAEPEEAEAETEASDSAAESSTASGRSGDILQDFGQEKYDFYRAVCSIAFEIQDWLDIKEGDLLSVEELEPLREQDESIAEEIAYLEESAAEAQERSDHLLTMEGMAEFLGKSGGRRGGNGIYYNKPDQQRTAAAVLAPYAKNLAELGALAKDRKVNLTFFRYDGYDLFPECGLDFDALYEAFSSGAASAALIPDTPQKAMAGIRVTDPVLFEKDGVRVTFDGCTTDGEADYAPSTFRFTVENNNPDNKKFFIDMKAFGVNGILLSSNISLNASSGTWYKSDGVEGGETLKLETKYEYGAILARACKALNISAADFPIETVAFVFDAKVGSDSEYERMGVVCRTDAWQNESFKNAFGEYAGTISNNAYYDVLTELDVYGKVDGNGLTAVLYPSKELSDPFAIGDYPETSWISFAVNERIANPTAGVEDENGGWIDTQYTFPGFAYVTRLYLTEDELRKQLEIGNSETMNIQLRIDSYGGVYEQFVTIATR